MTMHKSQGQTFEFFGVDLSSPVFNHGTWHVVAPGMLCMAFSRVKRQVFFFKLIKR